jgi:hypothetical protein
MPAIGVCARGKDVDARDTSAFTRVFDALCAGMTRFRFDRADEKKQRGEGSPLSSPHFNDAVACGAYCVTTVPTRLGAWPTGITALIFIAAVSIAVTELLAALEM